MTDKLERLTRIEAEAAALRKEIEAESKKTACFTPKDGEEYWQLGLATKLSKKHLAAYPLIAKPPKAAFRDEKTAKAYAEAFNVMLEMRLYADGGRWAAFVSDSTLRAYAGAANIHTTNAFSGNYSSKTQAQKAIDAVGEERIFRAVKVLCGEV